MADHPAGPCVPDFQTLVLTCDPWPPPHQSAEAMMSAIGRLVQNFPEHCERVRAHPVPLPVWFQRGWALQRHPAVGNETRPGLVLVLERNQGEKKKSTKTSGITSGRNVCLDSQEVEIFFPFLMFVSVLEENQVQSWTCGVTVVTTSYSFASRGFWN